MSAALPRRAAFAGSARSLWIAGVVLAVLSVGLPVAWAADTTAPAPVRGMTVSSDTTRVRLDWTSNREPDIAGYLVFRSTAPGGAFVRLTGTARRYSDFTDRNGPVGMPAYYRVVAVDKAGNRSAPVAAKGIRRDTVKPAAPSSASVTRSGTTSTVDWADSTEPDVAGYVVARATTRGGVYSRVTPAGTIAASTFTDVTVPAGATPYYRIHAVDHSRNWSRATYVSPLADRTAPVAVRDLVVRADTSSVALDWSPGTETDLAGYLVYRGAEADGSFTRLTDSPLTDSAHADTSAPIGVPTYYRVTAVDRTGNESTPVTASGTREDGAAPAAPQGLTAVDGTEGIRLDWDDNGEGDLAGYEVSRATTADGAYYRLTSGPVAQSAFLDATASTGATWYYRVTAVDTSGNASAAASASADRADTAAPAAPAGLTATGTAEGVSLTWAQNTDSDLAGYLVSRSATADGEFTAVTAEPIAGTAHLDSAAPAHVPSFYRVVAVDASGNRSPAATADATPVDAFAPAPPASLTATGSVADVTLGWADGTEPDLAGYLVSRAEQVDGTFTPLTQSPIAASEFVDDTAPAGVTSYYRVVAVDRTGNASAPASAEGIRTVAKLPVQGATVTVAQDGSGDFTTVGAALAAAPAGATPYVIGIRPGTYRETLTVDRAGVTLLGATADAADVVITYDNAAGTLKADGSGTYGTSGSATVLIKGNDVTTKNLTIENSYVETGSPNEQAVALKTQGDRLVFDNVRLLGDQDTLYADSPRAGALARSYYTNSYVEGDVDFVFGRGTAVFDRSTLKAATRGSTSNNGYITAASTDTSLRYGFLITDSTIVSDAPAQTFSLGRPWQPSGDVNAVAQVVIRDTELPAAIKPSPWTNMTTTFSWRDARFAEYQNTGPGAATAASADRPHLSDADAATHTKWTYLAGDDAWNPTGQPAPVLDAVAPAAPSAPSATAGDLRVDLSWAPNTDEDLAGYNLYRSTDADVAVTAAGKVNSSLLTSPAHTDRAGLANGTTYHYVVTAVDRTGNESAPSPAASAAPVGASVPAHDLLVAQDGSGQHGTVQAALDAAQPGTAADPTVIAVRPGTYEEMLTLSKPYVTVVGTTGDPEDVVLTYDNAAGTTIPGTTSTYGTGKSQSVLVSGSNVTVRDVTISNTFDEAAVVLAGGEQAVALHTTGDRLVFDDVRLLGNQDTVLVNSPDAPVIARSYFVNSYVEGDVDFIFGRGTAVFDRSTIHALSRGSSSNNGYITAASTSDHNPHGILITDSAITSNAPAGTFSLGRPWRGWSDGYTKNGVAYNSRGQVTIRDTELPAAIRVTQPWADMSPNLWTDGRFSEHGNTGAGATVNANRPQLTDGQAATSTKWAYLAGSDGWNPTGAPAPVAEVAPPVSGDTTAPAVPAGVATDLGKGTVTVSWTAVPDADVAGYVVHRSTGSEAPVRVSGSALVTGTSYTDSTGTVGTAYRYTVTAVDSAGNESAASAEASATPVDADVIVAADGSGDATTVQAGIDLLPNNADFTTQGGRVVLIQPGSYTGVVHGGNRYGVTLVGNGATAEDTVVTAGGTGGVATLTLPGKAWTVENLTVANTNAAAAAGAVATALSTQGDKSVFRDVRFLGDKTTLAVSSPNTTTAARAYFVDAYVEGGADMVLGRGTAVFDRSTFRVFDRAGASLTDSSVGETLPYGFLITDSTIVTDGAAGSIHLGRPYGTNGKAQVVVRDTEIGAGVSTAKPWKDWDATTTWTAGRFAEYQNTGPGALIVDPATRPQLADADAATYTAQAYLAGSDGWNPTGR